MSKKDFVASIIDIDLHIKDPHEIILSYFNTNNESNFVLGLKKHFMLNLLLLFIGLLMFKLFFQEKLTSTIVFLVWLFVSIILGIMIIFIIPFFVRIVNNSSYDGFRGIMLQFIFLTLLIVIFGLFL